MFLAVVLFALTLMTVDGALTWVAAGEASDVISVVRDRDGAIDDRGLILRSGQRAEIAADTDGDRLDRDLVDTKILLVVIALIAAAALTASGGPGSSRRVLSTTIVIAGGTFFIPLIYFSDTIDIVSTSYGG